MILSVYFFRQFIPSFFFGSVLFMFVLMLDKLFDIVDLLFNKGVNPLIVGKLFLMFIPTILPLTFPMALLLACLVTFGRLSEENELNAVRAAGISLFKALWLPLFFALFLSFIMIPFNSYLAPRSNQGFRLIYEKIISADPLINIEAKRFFNIKNIKLYAERVDKTINKLEDVFVYQTSGAGAPAERIYARSGKIETDGKTFRLELNNGQWQRYDADMPARLMHITFKKYDLSIPLNAEETSKNTRFRSLLNKELRKLKKDLKSKGLPTGPIEAEQQLRLAIAFAPFCLVLIGVPIATVLKRGGKSFSFGISVVIIFTYYLLLILGLTMAEKERLPAILSVWIANITCLIIGGFLSFRLFKK
ncbi:MAG: LptF/LptG family permease [Elusimicrobiota bacterium]